MNQHEHDANDAFCSDDDEEEEATTFPLDLVANILSRLPVKLLLQLRCVHKSWKSLISDPKFAQKHLSMTMAFEHHHHLMIYTNNGTESEIFLWTFSKAKIIDRDILDFFEECEDLASPTPPLYFSDYKYPDDKNQSLAVGGSDSSDRSKDKSDQKTLRRLAQNRKAARKCRLRKKAYVTFKGESLETSSTCHDRTPMWQVQEECPSTEQALPGQSRS